VYQCTTMHSLVPLLFLPYPVLSFPRQDVQYRAAVMPQPGNEQAYSQISIYTHPHGLKLFGRPSPRRTHVWKNRSASPECARVELVPPLGRPRRVYVVINQVCLVCGGGGAACPGSVISSDRFGWSPWRHVLPYRTGQSISCQALPVPARGWGGGGHAVTGRGHASVCDRLGRREEPRVYTHTQLHGFCHCQGDSHHGAPERSCEREFRLISEAPPAMPGNGRAGPRSGWKWAAGSKLCPRNLTILRTRNPPNRMMQVDTVFINFFFSFRSII
jgi:hypothetical protein